MAGTKRFGTVGGVFLPNVLTIFGVILFYRLGWLVGNTGLFYALLIVVIANLITLATAFSMSAIVTNTRIRGGGAYYLVSRSLGPEVGGAVGISLFFAQAVSIAFYVIGFTKALGFLPAFAGIDPVLLGFAVLGALTLLSIISASIAIKAQYLIFAAMMAALVSFFAGNLDFSVTPVLQGDFAAGGFWMSFAIFFPAATGIFAGLSLSGDLKEPHRSLPRGTIGAILFTGGLYVLVVVCFAFHHEPAVLLANEMLMRESAAVPLLVLLGVLAATFSSALGMILAAPRTLQALARDGIVPGILGHGSGRADEPRLAMLVSLGLAGAPLLLGNIDSVSQVLTMFFLAAYGSVNLIAAFEALIGNPAYRPTFRVHWLISLAGAIGCFLVMFLIDRLATLVALAVIALIHGWLVKRRLDANWGDIRKGFWASVLEVAIANFNRHAEHPRNFRPHVALLERQRRGRGGLLAIADLVSSRNGIVSQYIFLEQRAPAVEEAARELAAAREFVAMQGYRNVYPETIVTNLDPHAGRLALQADGIGDFKANTVLAAVYGDDRSLQEELVRLTGYLELGKHVLLYKDDGLGQTHEDRIDVWLSGFTQNLSLLLLVPFLITRNPDWSETRICLRMVVHSEAQRLRAERMLGTILAGARIPAEAVIESLGEADEGGPAGEENTVVDATPENFLSRISGFLKSFTLKKYDAGEQDRIRATIRRTSADARLVLLGLRVPEPRGERAYARELLELTKALPPTLLVKGHPALNVFR